MGILLFETIYIAGGGVPETGLRLERPSHVFRFRADAFFAEGRSSGAPRPFNDGFASVFAAIHGVNVPERELLRPPSRCGWYFEIFFPSWLLDWIILPYI
ncbi:hypothetical protein [uncultured Rhodoblastus sp.]|uniref:hypothetical protein n=1 Tax=uncultured Rhodoblastus sp. TaxID=543037 RepID=UPI0025F100D8|nr:hypothetical protein [uncultured Rhodoblastus sp.]